MIFGISRNLIFAHSRFTSTRLIYTSLRRNMRIENGSNFTIVHPEDGDHSATVILMHGLGDTADGWQDVAERWAQAFPYIKFVLPTASTIPVTLNGRMPMPAWYDIVGLTDRASESCEGIESSVTRIRSIIESEVALGIQPNRIALSGFSQGGAMSLFCGLQLPIELKPAGILVMSGYLPGASKFNLTPGLEDVKVLHCHGTADPVVRYDWATMSQEMVKSKGLQSYELKSYKGLQHSCTPGEIQDAAAFLSSILPHDVSLALARKDPASMSIKELRAAIKNAGLTSRTAGFTEKHEFVTLLNEYYASKA